MATYVKNVEELKDIPIRKINELTKDLIIVKSLRDGSHHTVPSSDLFEMSGEEFLDYKIKKQQEEFQ